MHGQGLIGQILFSRIANVSIQVLDCTCVVETFGQFHYSTFIVTFHFEKLE